MNFIDKLLTKPLMDEKSIKINLIDTDKNNENINNSLKRICYILGEPINFLLTPYIIKKKYEIKIITSCPYI